MVSESAKKGPYPKAKEGADAARLFMDSPQTRSPSSLFGKDFWQRVIHFDVLVEEGMISPEDPNLFHDVDTAEEAWALLSRTNALSTENNE